MFDASSVYLREADLVQDFGNGNPTDRPILSTGLKVKRM